MYKVVNVRSKYGGQIMAYDCTGFNPKINDWVIVAENNDSYIAKVVSPPAIWRKNNKTTKPCNASLFKDKNFIRLANKNDLAQEAENLTKEKEAFEYCLLRIKTQKLEMKLVAVEITFDKNKTVFYYTASERIDFRLLVKELVNRFRTRIEMRQIGVRHEAKMLGGIGNCGQHFCCAIFLPGFSPVSVKMAKDQDLSLNPAKISGVCSRLMCCLAYEHYEEDEVENSEKDFLLNYKDTPQYEQNNVKKSKDKNYKYCPHKNKSCQKAEDK